MQPLMRLSCQRLWVAKTPWRGKVTTSIWAQYTSRVGVLDLGRVHWRQTAVCLTRTNDRSRTRCLDHGNADWEGVSFNLKAAVEPVISNGRPVRSIAISSTSYECVTTAPQLELFTCQVKTSGF